MEKCPICRTNIELLSVTKTPLLDDLIKRYSEEPQIINYYSIKMSNSNIINYYSRKSCIECPICFNKMNSPRVLSCGHVVCLECNKKFNWNKGKFISADIWRNKYYQNVLKNQNIILYYNKSSMKLKRRIQELTHYRDFFFEKMQYYKNKSTIYNKELNKHLNNYLNKDIRKDLNKKSKNKYRTKICKWWIKGICNYSDEECSFAHGNKYLISNDLQLQNRHL